MTNNGNWITIWGNTKQKSDNKINGDNVLQYIQNCFEFFEELSNVLTALESILVTSNLYGKICEIHL